MAVQGTSTAGCGTGQGRAVLWWPLGSAPWFGIWEQNHLGWKSPLRLLSSTITHRCQSYHQRVSPRFKSTMLRVLIAWWGGWMLIFWSEGFEQDQLHPDPQNAEQEPGRCLGQALCLSWMGLGLCAPIRVLLFDSKSSCSSRFINLENLSKIYTERAEKCAQTSACCPSGVERSLMVYQSFSFQTMHLFFKH